MPRHINFILVVILAAAILFQPMAAQATLENEMQSMFNSMINVTDGGYHQAMGRGVVAGPSVVIRNSRVRTDLINFVPPSIEAGCGGIDMFLGSFSFINGEQFINLMQSIASNAAGYAFKIALQTMCPSCEQAMDNLQRAVQAINSTAGDSCRVAQHAVEFLADQAGTTELAQNIEQGPIGSLAHAVGDKADAFATWLNKTNTGSNTQSLDAEKVNELLGNIAWKALTKNNFIGSAFASGDAELAEALMSFTGTIIGYKDGDNDSPKIDEYPSTISAKDLLEGGSGSNTLKKWVCGGGNCLTMTQGVYTFRGLEKYVQQVLLGANLDAGADSMIAKLISNNGSLSVQERQLIRVSPYHTTRLRNMAVCTQGAGVGSLAQYAQKAARLIALEILQKYLHETTTALQAAAQTGTTIDGYFFNYALSPKFSANLKVLQQQVQTEFTSLQENLASTLEQTYQSATANCNVKPAYVRQHGS